MNIKTKYISEDGSKKVKIHFDKEWEEFQVKLWIDGKFQKQATYHTTDQVDAISTAIAMTK